MKLKVSIYDNTTLKLEEDGKKGDLIDLKEINKLDQSFINTFINQEVDKIYQEKLKDISKSFENEKKLEINKTQEEYKLKIQKLELELENYKNNLSKEFELKYQKEKNELLNKISDLEKSKEYIKLELENIYKDKLSEKDKQLYENKNLLEQKINELNYKLNNKDIEYKLQLEEEKNKLKEDFDKILQEKQDYINTIERKNLSVKLIGEDLEHWCDNEANKNLLLFNNIEWYKDNEAIKIIEEDKATKGDFIYKVYADETKKILLTSAMLEMKSEAKDSKKKQTNASFFDKLNKDRNKKNLEYALLVSELEMNYDNDLPIRKVQEYEKMYIIRPYYFISFLQILTLLGLKYKDIILQKEEERINFKDSIEILNEFEDFKNNILDNSLKYLEKNINDIKNQNNNIIQATNSINKSIDVIINTHLETIKNKINNFNITKLNNKIKKVI